MRTDIEIITQIRQNTRLNDAIMLLYQQHAESTYAFIMNNGGSRQDSEDIFQEAIVTFLELIKENKFRGDSSIKTFLIAIARNIWMNELRKRGRTVVREKLYEKGRDMEEQSLVNVIHQRETQQQLLAMLDKLGESCKKLLMLYYYDDLPMRDLADQLSYSSEQVARNKKYKCMKDLTEMLRENPVLAKDIKEKFNKY